MAIHKEVKTRIFVDSIINQNIKTLIMKSDVDGEVELTCVTLLESEFKTTLSWEEITKVLHQKTCLISGPVGSGLVKIVKEAGRVCITFSVPGKSGIDCYVSMKDFRDAIMALNNQR